MKKIPKEICILIEKFNNKTHTPLLLLTKEDLSGCVQIFRAKRRQRQPINKLLKNGKPVIYFEPAQDQEPNKEERRHLIEGQLTHYRQGEFGYHHLNRIPAEIVSYSRRLRATSSIKDLEKGSVDVICSKKNEYRYLRFQEGGYILRPVLIDKKIVLLNYIWMKEGIPSVLEDRLEQRQTEKQFSYEPKGSIVEKSTRYGTLIIDEKVGIRFTGKHRDFNGPEDSIRATVAYFNQKQQY